MSKASKIALWSASILLAALFLFAGLLKLAKPAQTAAMFAQFGYASWFAMLIGVCETLGGIGLLVPRVAALAAGGLSIIMVGAFFTMARFHQFPGAFIPVGVLVVLLGVIYGRLRRVGSGS